MARAQPDVCPLCRVPLVLPDGPSESVLGILSEFPGQDELIQRSPFVGGAGRVLKSELRRAGLDYSRFRVTNIWMHSPSEATGELDWHFAAALRTLRNCRAILVLGSLASDVLLDEKVTSVTGLRMKTDYLPKSVCIAAPNPANLFWGVTGEFRLALQKFSRLKEVS